MSPETLQTFIFHKSSSSSDVVCDVVGISLLGLHLWSTSRSLYSSSDIVYVCGIPSEVNISTLWNIHHGYLSSLKIVFVKNFSASALSFMQQYYFALLPAFLPEYIVWLLSVHIYSSLYPRWIFGTNPSFGIVFFSTQA